MLEYDNSAFYYFGISVSVIYLLPSLYYSGKRILFGCVLTDHVLLEASKDVRCEREMRKMRQLHAEKTKLSNIFTFAFLLNLLISLCAIVALVGMVNAVKDDGEIKTFDPFDILGISAEATEREVKKAYRKQSLMYHPDKNLDDAVAEGKFMMIAKAYEALTNEVAKENYKKYGNPDGRQALELSIGLPSFLLKPENHNLILFIYLMGLVVVIPSCVALWYSKSKKFGDGMIMYDTYGFYNFSLSENVMLKALPEILAGSMEFKSIPCRDEDAKELAELMKDYKATGLLSKIKYKNPTIVKANVLLHAHLTRKKLSVSLRGDLNRILKIVFQLTDGMFEICTMKSWLQTSINVIEFQQFLTQGLWTKDSSLLQLPNFTDNEVRHCMSGKGAIRNINQFIRVEAKARKGVATFSSDELAEVDVVCKNLPLIEMELDICVDDEESIAEGDIMTLTVKLTRENVAQDDTCDLVYAPEYPFPKAERWFVLIGDTNMNLMSTAKITKQDRVVEEKILLRAPSKQGTYILEVYLKSDSYLGLDQKQKIKFEVTPAADLPKYEMHPEDLELDDDPTLFQQIAGNQDDSSDEEEDSDDDDEDEDETSDTVMVEKPSAEADAAKASGDDSKKNK